MSHYNIDRIRILIREGQYRITTSALQGAFALGFLDDDVLDCILHSLAETHFYKTMPSEKVPGLWQDVYKLRYDGTPVYLKLQIDFNEQSVVISFKKDDTE